MKKLIVKKLSNYNYQLEDDLGNNYQLNIEFHGLNKKLEMVNYMNMIFIITTIMEHLKSS